MKKIAPVATESKTRVPFEIAIKTLTNIPAKISRAELERELLVAIALLMGDAQEHEPNELEFVALDLACCAVDLASRASSVASPEQIDRAKTARECLTQGKSVRGTTAETATRRGDLLVAIHEVFEGGGVASSVGNSYLGLLDEVESDVSQVSRLAGRVILAARPEQFAGFGLTFGKLLHRDCLKIAAAMAKPDVVKLSQRVIDTWGKRGQWRAVNDLLRHFGLQTSDEQRQGKALTNTHPLAREWQRVKRLRKIP